jgi:hypothetical protein
MELDRYTVVLLLTRTTRWICRRRRLPGSRTRI